MIDLKTLRCNECGPTPEDNVTRCIRCMAADEVERLIIKVSKLKERGDIFKGKCADMEKYIQELEGRVSSNQK